MIYVDNAATTRMSPRAIAAMTDYLDHFYDANASSLHTPGQKAKQELERARQRVAQCLNCLPAEIYFTSGGSESDNQALLTGAAIGARKGKRHIISTKIEHHAVLHTLDALAKQGYEIELLDVAPATGLVTPEQVAAAIRDDTALVSVMYANNEIGTIEPIAQIGEVCREKGVLLHTDTVQAAGHLPLDFKAMNVDLASISAHKFHGPKGVGATFCRRGVIPANVIYGGAQERGRRAGTENVAAICAMAEALCEAVEKQQENSAKLREMRDELIVGLSKIPHSVLNGDPVNRLPGNVHFCFEGIEGESLLLLLDQHGIAASSGSACTSGSLDPSHVLLAIGRPHEIAHGSLRLSLSEYNTSEEMQTILRVVPEVVDYLRSFSPVWDDLQKGVRTHVI